MNGSDFIEAQTDASQAEFEAAVLAAEESWIHWPMVEVPVSTSPHRASIFVSKDVFAIGTAEDPLRCPISGPVAQEVADRMHLMLPTPKMSDLIWHEAAVKLKPITGDEIGIRVATDDQTSVRALGAHNDAVQKQLAGRHGLVAGHKKDVVLTNRLTAEFRKTQGFGGPGQVAIYGWQRPNGVPIQPLSTVHAASYWDYSHGIRLVSPMMRLDGAIIHVADVLSSAVHAPLVSYEGVLRCMRYAIHVTTPPGPASTPTSPRTLRIGASGMDVERVQRAIGVTADGTYGPRTEAAVKEWQRAHGLDADGVFGANSWAALSSGPPPTPRNEAPVTGDEPGTAFVEARNYTKTSGRKVDWVVVHSMELPEKGDTAESCARMFANTDRDASCHYTIDSDSVVQCVRERDVAWAAPGANRAGIQLEHAGYARQTADEWSDPYSKAMLERSAVLTARICKRHSIPVEFVDAEGLLAGARGITTHWEASKACRLAKKRSMSGSTFFKATTDHYDPGPGWPMRAYLEMVRA